MKQILATVFTPLITVYLYYRVQKYLTLEEKKEDLLWGKSSEKFLKSICVIVDNKDKPAQPTGEIDNARTIARNQMKRIDKLIGDTNLDDGEKGRIREFCSAWKLYLIPELKKEQESYGRINKNYEEDFMKDYPNLQNFK